MSLKSAAASAKSISSCWKKKKKNRAKQKKTKVYLYDKLGLLTCDVSAARVLYTLYLHSFQRETRVLTQPLIPMRSTSRDGHQSEETTLPAHPYKSSSAARPDDVFYLYLLGGAVNRARASG